MHPFKIPASALFLYILLCTSCARQNNNQELKSSSEAEEKNRIYLLQTDSILTGQLFLRGESLSNDSLLKRLEPYKAKAWSSPNLTHHRALYYYYLASNADILNKGGLMFFYVNKFREEVGSNHPRAIISVLFILNYYSRISDHKKIIHTFEEEEEYLHTQTIKIKNEPFNSSRYRNLINIYIIAGQAYLENEKLIQSKYVLEEIKNLEINLKKNVEADDFDIAMAFSTTTLLQESINLQEGKTASLKENISIALKKLKVHEKSRPEESLLFQGYLKELLAKYYFHTKQFNEAIKIYDSMNLFNPDFIESSSRDKAIAYINIGRFKEASGLFLNAYNLKEKENLTLTTEVNELLNAHIEAEYNRLELQEAEEVKKRRLLWVIAISIISILLLTFLYYLFSKEKRQLKQLSKITDIQISEAMQRAIQEERKKIGQDLHDDLSGSLATLLYNIDATRVKEESTALDNMYNELQDIYSKVRNKSHQNFYATEDISEDHLEESIQKIVNTALNDNIKREIDIDKNASILLNTATRIEFLRIIQEAMANIVKHAQKVTEVFIYLYEDEGYIFLEIGDDGIPSNSKNRNGIGILSITERVKALNGKIVISKEGDGFTIEIKVPF